MESKMNNHFEYPFSKGYVFLSAVLIGLSIFIATFILIGEEPIPFWIGNINFMIPALLLYFLFTAILSLIMLILKFHLYSIRWARTVDSYSPESEETDSGSIWKSIFIPLLILIIIALSLPLILLALLRPLWWFISLSGFIAGINIPEIILYVYSRRSVK
jgi:hypothetical protein